MNDRDGDQYNLKSGIYPDEPEVYVSVFQRRRTQFSTAAHMGTSTIYSTCFRAMKTSPSLTQWLDVVGRNPEYLFTIEPPNPPYQAYQWMEKD